MILRRIANALRNQDWGTVAMEIAIVVVGIFLGLQVDGWNQSRIDRQTERMYLSRIHDSLADDVASIEQSIRTAASRRAMGELLIAALDDEDLAMKDPNAFLIAIEQAGYTLSPSIDDYAFEELKDSGNIAIIGNIAIRESITSYYRMIERYGQWGYIREAMQTKYMNTKLGVLTADQYRKVYSCFGDGKDLGFTETEAMEALERMHARPAFIEQIPQASNNKMAIDTYTLWRDVAIELRSSIAQEIGLPVEQLPANGQIRTPRDR